MLEGVEDRSDSLASNMIKREPPQEYDLGEQLPHLNNQGRRSLAQELTDAQRRQGRNQWDDHRRNHGLAPNMENRPAYLSGHEEDIMAYLYGDQASEMVCRVKRHAGHYQSQCGQGGGGGGEPDGRDNPHEDDNDRRNERPGNRHGRGGLPSGNRNDPFLGRGGRPPRGPPGPPGDPPSDSSAHQSDSSNHSSETDCRNDNSNNHGERPNYLRGYTPGNDRYIELAMRRYSQRIDEQVGEEPDGPLGPEVKAMNPPKPEKYAGEDDIDKFDEWLVQLLAYFQIFKIMGLRTDTTRVQYMGLYLSKLAQQWYSQEVLAPTRCV